MITTIKVSINLRKAYDLIEWYKHVILVKKYRCVCSPARAERRISLCRYITFYGGYGLPTTGRSHVWWCFMVVLRVLFTWRERLCRWLVALLIKRMKYVQWCVMTLLGTMILVCQEWSPHIPLERIVFIEALWT